MSTNYCTLTVAAVDKSQRTTQKHHKKNNSMGEELQNHALIFTPPKNNYGGRNSDALLSRKNANLR
jgi:hypothetical protein